MGICRLGTSLFTHLDTCFLFPSFSPYLHIQQALQDVGCWPFLLYPDNTGITYSVHSMQLFSIPILVKQLPYTWRQPLLLYSQIDKLQTTFQTHGRIFILHLSLVFREQFLTKESALLDKLPNLDTPQHVHFWMDRQTVWSCGV